MKDEDKEIIYRELERLKINIDKYTELKKDYIINLRIPYDTLRWYKTVQLAQIYKTEIGTCLYDRILKEAVELALKRKEDIIKIDEMEKEVLERRKNLFKD